MTVEEKLETKISAGVVFLNVARPTWLYSIDLKRLDLSSSRSCMLGEIYGAYVDGKFELQLEDETAELFGFWLKVGKNYPLLTKLWKIRIRKLLRKKMQQSA